MQTNLRSFAGRKNKWQQNMNSWITEQKQQNKSFSPPPQQPETVNICHSVCKRVQETLDTLLSLMLVASGPSGSHTEQLHLSEAFSSVSFIKTFENIHYCFSCLGIKFDLDKLFCKTSKLFCSTHNTNLMYR